MDMGMGMNRENGRRRETQGREKMNKVNSLRILFETLVSIVDYYFYITYLIGNKH